MNYVIKVDTDHLKTSIAQMRYRAYLNMGAIEANQSGEYRDPYDVMQNSFHYLNKNGDTELGSIRASIYSEQEQFAPIPAFDPFYREIIEAFGKKSSFLQGNHLVVDPACQSTSMRHVLALFRVINLNAIIHELDYVLGTIFPNRVKLYKKLLGFEPISAPKIMKGLNVPPCVLVGTSRETFINVSSKTKQLRISQDQVDHYLETGILQSNF